MTHRLYDMPVADVYVHYVDKIEDPLMKQIRYLDKLVDEVAKGRPMSKVLRTRG